MNEVIIKIRETIHLSQKAFANCIGVSQQTVSNYESGKRSPDKTIAQRIISLGEEAGMDIKASDWFRDSTPTENIQKNLAKYK